MSDEKKRKLYDSGFDADSQQAPPGWQQGGYTDFGGFQGFEQFTQGYGGGGFDPFESIFEMMNEFAKPGRGKAGKREVQRGRDITIGNLLFLLN